jgi:hypothetical protein
VTAGDVSGAVYRAFDEVLQRVVALKAMAPQLSRRKRCGPWFQCRPQEEPGCVGASVVQAVGRPLGSGHGRAVAWAAHEQDVCGGECGTAGGVVHFLVISIETVVVAPVLLIDAAASVRPVSIGPACRSRRLRG